MWGSVEDSLVGQKVICTKRTTDFATLDTQKMPVYVDRYPTVLNYDARELISVCNRLWARPKELIHAFAIAHRAVITGFDCALTWTNGATLWSEEPAIIPECGGVTKLEWSAFGYVTDPYAGDKSMATFVGASEKVDGRSEQSFVEAVCSVDCAIGSKRIEFGFAGYRPYNPSEGAVVNNVWRKEKELVTQMIKLASWVGEDFTAAKVSELEDQLPKTMEALLNKQLAGCSPLMRVWWFDRDVCDLSKGLIPALINLQVSEPGGLYYWNFKPSIPNLATFDAGLAETVSHWWTASSFDYICSLNAAFDSVERMEPDV